MVANTHSSLLAGDWVGCPGAPCLFSALVVDVWNANPSRLDGSAIRYHGAANHPYLHGRRIGFPDFFGEALVDLKESFYAHCRWFFSLGVAIIMVSVCKHLLLDGKLPNPTYLIFQAMFGVTLFIGALTRQEWYHKTLVVFTNAAFVLYIVLLYARMR